MNWRTPDPLPSALLPVAPFDLDFLPARIVPWVTDTAELMQCPIDFVAIPAMITIAATIGRKIAIRPKRNTDWCEVANLWGMIIGPPGSMKSPALAQMMKPLRRLEMLAREANKTALKEFEVAAEISKIREDAAKRAFKDELKKNPNATPPAPISGPIEPALRRYIVDDATYEALGSILSGNPNGVLAFRDELVSLLRTLEREEYAAARGFFLSAWNGLGSYTFDRIIRGTQHIEAACASFLGGTQPGMIANFVRRSIDEDQGDDGMIQRFSLAIWPDDIQWSDVDRYPDTTIKQATFDMFKRLDTFSPFSVGAIQDEFDPIPYLRFDPRAQEMFSNWHRWLETTVVRGDNGLSQAIKGHFSKYRKLVPALALINYLVDDAREGGDINERNVDRAIAFSHYLETHAKRIYAAGSKDETDGAKEILKHIRRGDLRDGFTARDTHRSRWSNLTNIDHVKSCLELLVDLGWLAERAIKPVGGGRPTVAYSANPACQRER